MVRIVTLTPNPTYDFAVDVARVEPNRKLRCSNPASHPGGGGLNVARAARRLGADTLAIFTAGGLYGAALKGLVAEEGVPMRATQVAGETRLAFHVRDELSRDEYRFNLPGTELSAAERSVLLGALEEEIAAGDYVVGSGSVPPMRGERTQERFWADAAAIARANGAHFVLDSINGVAEALKVGVHIFRCNEHEYQALAGGTLRWPDEISGFAQSLVETGGAERAIITHAGDGSVMATRDGLFFAPVLPVRAHSAVGAGDSFVAGLIVALMRAMPDADALRFAAACAAATRLSEGNALFQAADVQRLFASAEARLSPA